MDAKAKARTYPSAGYAGLLELYLNLTWSVSSYLNRILL